MIGDHRTVEPYALKGAHHDGHVHVAIIQVGLGKTLRYGRSDVSQVHFEQLSKAPKVTDCLDHILAHGCSALEPAPYA